MDDASFTAGITLHDDRTLTVDVTSVDASGIGYTSDRGPERVPWADVKAVMLATTDHMLESGGYLFSMSELVEAQEGAEPYDAASMRRFGFGLLQQAAPRVCPLGAACGLRPPPTAVSGENGGGDR